jgi:uncharacterized caspase-like protein
MRSAFILLVIVFATLSGQAGAEKRVALVIGNSAYTSIARLPNPVNDAADMAGLLAKIGFSVTHKSDQGFIELRKSLQDFGKEADGAQFAIIYFAGHGIEIEKRNFILPTDVRLTADYDVEFEAIPLDLLMNALAGVSGVRVVLLDACRNNPFLAAMKRSNATRSIGRGLAAIEPPSGTLVGYAAKEGTVAFDGGGRNSPYTAGLLRHLGEADVDIQFVFRKVRDTVLANTGGIQEPFTYGSLPGKEIFIAPQSGESTTPSRNPADATEIEFWTTVRASRNRKALERYIELYPEGAFASLARLEIEGLDAATGSLADRPPASGPGLARQIQSELHRVGCQPGNPDGIWGARSREALRRYGQYAKLKFGTLEPTASALIELQSRSERICPAIAAPPKSKAAAQRAAIPKAQPTVKAKPTAQTSRKSEPARVCRLETRDECRVRARASGARRRSGFCRIPATICN